MSGQLSREQREMITKWKGEIKKGIERKETRVEELKREIEGLKFKFNTIRPVKDLIKEAMTLGVIEIRGAKRPCDPQTLDQCISLSKIDQEELEKKLKTKRAELRGLELEIIIDHQRLIVLKKDLEESG